MMHTHTELRTNMRISSYLLKVGVAPDGPGASDVEYADDDDDDDGDEDLVSRDTCHPDHLRMPSPGLASLAPGHILGDLSI